MRAAPVLPPIVLPGPLECREPPSLRPIKAVRLDCLSPDLLDRSESLVGRKRVLPSFIGKTVYPEPASPTPSDEAEEFMDRIEDVIQKLEEYVERWTAEWRRENTDYCDGETPKTSQESDFQYSQRSVSEIASPEEVAEFIFKNEEHAFLQEALEPFMGGKVLKQEEFKAQATGLLMADPKALVHVLQKVLERARQKARQEQVDKELKRISKRQVVEVLESASKRFHKLVEQRSASRVAEEELAYIRKEFPDLH